MSSATALNHPHLAFELMCVHKEPQKREGEALPEFDLQSSIQNLICYGVDERLLQEQLLPFLEKNSKCRLFLIEEDLAHLIYVLESEWGQINLTHPRITIDTLSRGVVALSEIAQKTLFYPYQWISVFKDKGTVWEQSFEKERTHLMMHMGMYRDFGADMAQSCLTHIRGIARASPSHYKWGPSLQGRFKGKTVVVCGAGPSLKSALPWLKKEKNKVVIFAAGSAINMMSKAGLKPHLAAVIDPSPPHDRYNGEGLDQSIPLFYQFQTDPHAIKDFSSTKLLWGLSELFPFESLLMKELNLATQVISTGFHAGNFATHIAASLGFKQIVLVGLEGCEHKGKQYGFDVDEKSVEPMEVEALDFKGRPVLTKPEFLKGVEVTKAILQENPDTEFIAYNDKGLAIEGVSILQEHSLASSSPISQEEISAIIEQADNLEIMEEQRQQVIDHLEKSLQECFSWSKVMLSSLSLGKKGPCYQESLLVTEPFFDEVVYPLWLLFKPMLMAQVDKEDEVVEIALLEKIQKGLFTEKVIQAYREVVSDDKAL